jgi:hypothetical protein
MQAEAVLFNYQDDARPNKLKIQHYIWPSYFSFFWLHVAGNLVCIFLVSGQLVLLPSASICFHPLPSASIRFNLLPSSSIST